MLVWSAIGASGRFNSVGEHSFSPLSPTAGEAKCIRCEEVEAAGRVSPYRIACPRNSGCVGPKASIAVPVIAELSSEAR